MDRQENWKPRLRSEHSRSTDSRVGNIRRLEDPNNWLLPLPFKSSKANTSPMPFIDNADILPTHARPPAVHSKDMHTHARPPEVQLKAKQNSKARKQKSIKVDACELSTHEAVRVKNLLAENVKLRQQLRGSGLEHLL